MVEQTPNGLAPAAGARQGRVALIGLGVAVVIAAAAVGGWTIATSGGGQEPQAGSGPVASTASPTATATPIPKKITPNQTFKSASGNITCSIGLFAGQPGAICEQHKVNYAIPAGACPLADDPGVFVGVGTDGGYWPCEGYSIYADQTLAYDTPMTQSGITCTINLATGVKCVNTKGKGFTMEYNAGIAFI